MSQPQTTFAALAKPICPPAELSPSSYSCSATSSPSPSPFCSPLAEAECEREPRILTKAKSSDQAEHDCNSPPSSASSSADMSSPQPSTSSRNNTTHETPIQIGIIAEKSNRANQTNMAFLFPASSRHKTSNDANGATTDFRVKSSNDCDERASTTTPFNATTTSPSCTISRARLPGQSSSKLSLKPRLMFSPSVIPSSSSFPSPPSSTSNQVSASPSPQNSPLLPGKKISSSSPKPSVIQADASSSLANKLTGVLDKFVTAKKLATTDFTEFNAASEVAKPAAAASFESTPEFYPDECLSKSDFKKVSACSSKGQVVTVKDEPSAKQAIPREKTISRLTFSAITNVSPSRIQASSVISNTQARLIDLGKQLLEAARQGQVESVRKLVDSGAPFTSDWLGSTALHFAAQIGSKEIVEVLLRGGVNRDARTKLDRTALHLAAQSGSSEVVDLLVMNGCDVNALDMLKMTPLHWAVERSHMETVERLLFHGADLNAINKFHLTPLEVALDQANNEIIEIMGNYRSDERGVSHANITTAPSYLVGGLSASSNRDHLHQHQNHQILNAPGCSDQFFRSIEADHFGNSSSSNNNCNNNNNTIHGHFTYRNHLALLTASSEMSGLEQCEVEDDVTKVVDRVLGIDEPCIDMVELEWGMLKAEPEFFLAGEEDSSEPNVEVLMKIVGELQRENKQLRLKVEQLQTSSPTNTTITIDSKQ